MTDPPADQLGLDLDHKRPFPPQPRFPTNFGERRVGETLSRDLIDARDPLVVTGYAGVEELLSLLHAWQQRRATGQPPQRVRLLVGVEPTIGQTRARLHRPRSAEIEIGDYWLDRGVSLLQCHQLLAAVEILESGLVLVRASAGARVHAKIYVGDSAATLGSSNYTRPGLTSNLEANARFDRTDEPERFREAREFAERLWEEGRPYTEAFKGLLARLLRRVTWQEALARACTEILEGEWASDPDDREASSLWPSQEQGIAQALWVLDNVGSVLVADATGSGKTRTGAHLLSALQSRNWRTGRTRNRQPVLICPPAVGQKWREEFAEAGESVSVFSHGILGRSGVRRQAEVSAALRGTSVLIVDEAHNFLNPNSARARALLTNTADHLILLTATPINRGVRDLLAIIDLLGADNFEDDVLEIVGRLGRSRRRRVAPLTPIEQQQIRSALQQFVVRRTKSELNTLIDREQARYINARGDTCRFPNHQAIVFSRSGPDLDEGAALEITDLASRLKGVVNLRKVLKMPWMYRIQGKTEEQFLRMRLGGARALASYQVRSRLRSSRAALIEHLVGSESALDELGIEGKKAGESGDVIKTLIGIRGSPPTVKLDIVVPPWLADAEEHARAVDEEIGIYEDILAQARRMSGHRAEKNADYLAELAKRHDRLIAFDSHPISLLDLEGRLKERGVEPLVATGRMPSKQRAAFSRRFGLESTEEGIVGLLSDAFAEGLNLQGASSVVHLDLPTVIRVLEQRIGRVDRMDSPHESIEVHWPKEESPAYALRSDDRLFLRLADVKDLIGSNVPVPEELGPDSLDAERPIDVAEIIEAVERGEESRVALSDAFARVRSLVAGPDARVPEDVYARLRGSEARVLSSVSAVRADHAWVFVAIGASDRATPRWVMVDRPDASDARVDGMLDSVAAELMTTLTPGSEGLPFAKGAATLLADALAHINRHHATLLPRRKQKALEELRLVSAGYSKAAARNGDSQRVSILNEIDDRLNAKSTTVDLNRVAGWWLSLLRPEWHEHVASRRGRRPTKLKDLRKRLKNDPISTERLETFFEDDFSVLPIERRVVAAIVGMPG